MALSIAPEREKPASTRDDVIRRLKEHESDIRILHATALYLFGSAARDEMSSDSDVDMFVDYDPSGPFSFIELLRAGDVVESILQRKVDLTTRDGLHPRLRAQIEASSIRVF